MNTRKITFKSFLKENWSELVEYAEEATGEEFDGQEPLLTKETVIELGKETYENLDENLEER